MRTAYQTFGNMRHPVEDDLEMTIGSHHTGSLSSSSRVSFSALRRLAAQIECSIIYITHFHNGRFRECWLDRDTLLSVQRS